MKRGALLIVLVILAATSSVSLAGAQGGGAQDRARQAARARWEKLSPAERQRMRDRFQKLERMSPEQRERVTRQANRLNEMRRGLWKSLDRVTRARLDGLGNRKRLELLDEMLAGEIEGTAQRIIERMPEKDRERLRAAQPSDRLRFLVERKRRQEQESDLAMRRIMTELGVRPGAASGMRDLPPVERRAKMREVLRAHIVKNVDARELPAGIDRAGWKRIQALPEDEFFLAVVRLRRTHPSFGSGTANASSPRARLRRALQVEPADRMALSHLPPQERREELQLRQRARAMKIIVAEGLVPPARIAELEAQPFPRFMRIVRGLTSRPRPNERRAPGTRRRGD